MFENEIEELASFYRLPGNWDKHGSQTIGFRAILKAIQVITLVYAEYARKPYLLSPTRFGGISLEYQEDQSTIEIEVYDIPNEFAFMIDLGPDVHPDERFFIEDNVSLERLIYRIGQIVDTQEDDYVYEIGDNHQIVLPAEDFDRLMEIINEPLEPNEALTKAMKEYDDAVASGKLVTDVESN